MMAEVKRGKARSEAGRPKTNNGIKLSPEAKRFNIVYDEFREATGGSTVQFALLMDKAQSSVSRMLNGLTDIPLDVIRIVCFKLGYSPEWFIVGTGPRKAKKDDVKLLSEVSLLRQDMAIMLNKNKALEARMLSYEKDAEEIKKLLTKHGQNL